MTESAPEGYLRVLEPWARGARRHLYHIPGKPGLACYGIGNHGHWAIQANTTAFAGFAVLAADSRTQTERTGMSRDELLHTALALLRFTLTSHHSGEGSATDGAGWGHSWISALCIERMMHAVEMLDRELQGADRAALRRLLVSEADWLLDHYTVVAGLVENNKPESNMWNGALLHRVARMVPDAARRADYLQKGTVFLMNAISVPSDATGTPHVDGRPVAEWHVGPNFFETYACNHHRYLNIGYMVVTLSNAAMLHFSCRRNGWTPPEALYHHVADLWPLVKSCTFPDGRLLRIGGDTRVRYCYCQDYAIPVWLMMQDRFGDTDCAAFEAGWLQTVATEQQANQDGSCLGGRLRRLEALSPLYYTRLEGDKAASLSMGASYRSLMQSGRPAPEKNRSPRTTLLQSWGDDYHGACLVRSPRRIASWVWEAAEKPQGICLSPEQSALGEWRTNMAGSVRGLGLDNDATVLTHTEHRFEGGFCTAGSVRIRTRNHAAEGEQDHDVARLDLAFAALPDDGTVVGLQRARVPARTFLRGVKGLHLHVPNDLFNGSSRAFATPSGPLVLLSSPGLREVIPVGGGWLNVDDCMGILAVYGGEELIIYRSPSRQITVRSHGALRLTERPPGSLYTEEICLGACSDAVTSYDTGQSLFDIGFAVRTGITASETRVWHDAGSAARLSPVLPLPDMRAVQVKGVDGTSYVVAANFGEQEATLVLQTAGKQEATSLVTGRCIRPTGDGTMALCMAPADVTVLRWG